MERDEAVIESVREYPCLYNSCSSEYKVQSKKENAWTAIAELLERSGKHYVMPRVIFMGGHNSPTTVELICAEAYWNCLYIDCMFFFFLLTLACV